MPEDQSSVHLSLLWVIFGSSTLPGIWSWNGFVADVALKMFTNMWFKEFCVRTALDITDS